ncbi:hypothetical protein N0M98_00825 [Paenibacillus doosanensis]|nr:hypothetical protein [Paenibacillus doosanensis]
MQGQEYESFDAIEHELEKKLEFDCEHNTFVEDFVQGKERGNHENRGGP